MNYIKSWLYRLFTGLQYGKDNELIAYSVNRFEQLLKEYEVCKKYNYLFVIYNITKEL